MLCRLFNVFSNCSPSILAIKDRLFYSPLLLILWSYPLLRVNQVEITRKQLTWNGGMSLTKILFAWQDKHFTFKDHHSKIFPSICKSKIKKQFSRIVWVITSEENISSDDPWRINKWTTKVSKWRSRRLNVENWRRKTVEAIISIHPGVNWLTIFSLALRTPYFPNLTWNGDDR